MHCTNFESPNRITREVKLIALPCLYLFFSSEIIVFFVSIKIHPEMMIQRSN